MDAKAATFFISLFNIHRKRKTVPSLEFMETLRRISNTTTKSISKDLSNSNKLTFRTATYQVSINCVSAMILNIST